MINVESIQAPIKRERGRETHRDRERESLPYSLFIRYVTLKSYAAS